MKKLQSPDDCEALLLNRWVLGLPGQELATHKSNRMLFSQWIVLTEDSSKAPVGDIHLENVGLSGVSDLQNWCTREVILKTLEISFLVVTPVHQFSWVDPFGWDQSRVLQLSQTRDE